MCVARQKVMFLTRARIHHCIALFCAFVLFGGIALGRGSRNDSSAPQASMRPTRYPPVTCLAHFANPSYCLGIDAAAGPDFDRFLRTCAWHERATESLFDSFAVADIVVDGQRMYGGLPYDDELRGDYAWRPNTTIRSRQCTQLGDGGWRAVLAGPFTTTGGYFWTAAEGKLGSAAFGFGAATDVLLSGYMLGSVEDATYRILGYPPLHQHHFHMWGADAPFSDALNTHGENQCTPDEGGVHCYVKHAPDGLAFRVRTPIAFSNGFQDVRSRRSPPMTHWIVLAVKPYAGSEAPALIRQSVLAIYPQQRSSRWTYVIDAHADSVIWDEGRLDRPRYFGNSFDVEVRPIRDDEEVLEVYMHAHADHVYDVWFFQGQAQGVFDNMTAANASFREPDYGAGVISRAMLNIRRRQLRAGAAPLSCSYKYAARQEEVTILGKKTQVMRKPRCGFKPSVREWTLIVFHTNPIGYFMSYARMHALVRIYFKAS